MDWIRPLKTDRRSLLDGLIPRLRTHCFSHFVNNKYKFIGLLYRKYMLP